ncbi:hypothetical protein ACHAPT_006968 [Fusarium lateritium]
MKYERQIFNGEITDPPVATEREAPATQYAVPRQSPPSSPRDSIFCSTCLKNQRLFTSSLAQYLPDDPNHPDYPGLERNYYRYRKGLEERYPQVCDECAERVEGQIRRAGYTAKTDHLRRMMEKSRGRRVDPGRNTALDWAHSLGRGLWWGGLAMQMLWHFKTLAYVLEHTDEGMYDPDDRSWPTMAVAGLAWTVAFLPPADTLINGAVMASILSAWWNPQFVQVSRGFTRHLLGFTQWYSFQGLIIFFRILFRRVLEMNGGRAQSRSAQLSAHMVMSVVMIMVTKRKKEERKTFSELLNEALDSPTLTPKRDRPSQPLVNPLPRPYPPSNPVRIPESPRTQFNNLNITPRRTQEVQYSDEMDWTPTESPAPSQHRAFREMPPSNAPRRAFGESPVSAEQNAFWYKVPAAPTTPSQRLRNPPNAPVLRGKPVEQESIFFRGAAKAQGQRQQEDESEVAFKPPSFFAPQESNDEANSLADMLSQSFSLSQEESQQGDASARRPSGWTSEKPPFAVGPQLNKLGVEFMALAALLVVWGLTLAIHTPFRREMQLAFLSAAGTIALRVTGEASRETKEEQGPSTATYVGSVLSVMELATVCWLGWEVWQGSADAGKYGMGVLTVMLGHQVWSSMV